MAEFQVRSDAVDVEQIMRQIRARIREKRGADYTEQEIRELASVKLEKFLDPRGVRSNLVEEFRRNRPISPEPKKIETGEIDIYGTHRGALRTIRNLLNPLLKMLFNPTPLIHAINTVVTEQNAVNSELHKRFRQREEMDPLYYEVTHNLVVELTRLSIENNNLKMRVESLSSRMDFDERRARALETVVQYKPAPRPGQPDRPQGDRSQADRPQGERQSDRAQPDRSQNDRSRGDRPQADRSQSDRPQADRSQSDRPQADRSQSDRPQADRSPAAAAVPAGTAPAETAQPDRPQADRSQPDLPQADRSPNDPQRAGLEPRDQGERGDRRRRRRRRRRPGQNMANGTPGVQGPESKVQGQSGVQGSVQDPQSPESSVQSPESAYDGADADGDYDGPDDDGSDESASDGADPLVGSPSNQAPDAQMADNPTGDSPMADSPISDDPTTRLPDSPPSPEGSKE